MKQAAAFIFFAALSGCGAEDASETSKAGAGAASLPLEPFQLKCGSGTGNPPAFATHDFIVRINPKNRTYAFPGWSGEMPIKKIDPNAIVLRDEAIKLGRDNNPENWRIDYDLRSRILTYRESASGIVPIEYHFTSECGIA